MMRRLRLFAFAALVPALALLLGNAGCGDKPKGNGGGGKDTATEPKESADLKPFQAKGRGTVKGIVVLGDPKPNLEELDKAFKKMLNEAKQDKEHCLKQEGESKQQTWIIDDKGNVANVAVWVAPPANHYFTLEDKDRDPKARGVSEVVIDQPHCAFTPRVMVLFPSYYDAGSKEYKASGQSVKVTNSGTLNHNTNWGGSGVRGDNKTVGPNAKLDIPPSQLTASGLKPPVAEVTFSCQIHPWMRAFARSLDHPFAAVSGQDGTFEIKDVPAGADMRLMYWHESMKAPRELKKITLMDGGTADEKITVSAQ